VAVGFAVVGVPAQAQELSKADEQVKTRQRISTMEGVLERAVSNGAENLLRQVRTVMPDAPMLSGVPRVRGFKLEGYGVFFDVEVPALRLPVTWPLRYLIEDNRAAVSAALAELRTMIADQPARDRDRFEMLAREALIDAMIEHSGPIPVGVEEWLTVAARDNAPRDPLMPGDTAGLNTLIFRVKGVHLAAFRTGKISLDEARSQVEVQEH
jgi:hypothetical protein